MKYKKIATIISKNIPIDAECILDEIRQRQTASWNNGKINDYLNFPYLTELYKIINSGIPEEDFFYKGDLFRIHSAYVGLSQYIDPAKEIIVGKICSDDSCKILSTTEYSEKLVAFSKSFDFTDRNIYNKIFPTERAVIIHVNTKSCYGIDVNKLQVRFGIKTRYAGEQEVLFPLKNEFVVKEYNATPNKVKYYFRKFCL